MAPQVDPHGLRVRVLRDVLQRLEAREVDGGLRILREAPDPVGDDLDRHGRLARLRLERGEQALVRQERRVDAARQVPQILERPLRVALQLRKHLVGARGIALEHRLRQPHLHAQRHQLLLRSVVDVALETPSLLVLRGDESALRRLQFVEPLSQRLRQADVAQHQPGLRREIGDQLLLGGVHRVVGRHRHREGPELLALMEHGLGAIVVAGGGVGGPGRGDPPRSGRSEPHTSALGAERPRPGRGPSARARRPRRRNPRADRRTR